MVLVLLVLPSGVNIASANMDNGVCELLTAVEEMYGVTRLDAPLPLPPDEEEVLEGTPPLERDGVDLMGVSGGGTNEGTLNAALWI